MVVIYLDIHHEVFVLAVEELQPLHHSLLGIGIREEVIELVLLFEEDAADIALKIEVYISCLNANQLYLLTEQLLHVIDLLLVKAVIVDCIYSQDKEEQCVRKK